MKQKLTKLEKYWVLYDVGNSAFTLLVSTIIPIYFKNMAQNMGVSASDSTAYLSYAISISTIIVAILGPILGAVADNKNHKKPLFTFFMMIGVLGCAALSIPKTWLMFLIIFDGPKYGDDLLAVYRQNHVLVLPSTYEPWGLVVNEAMSAGMPVLVSNEVGAHYDLVDGNDTGFVFDAYEEQSLIDAMEQISNMDTYKKYADNAYNFMHNYWNYSLYRKCLEYFINKTA